jgi:DNA-directed RNA polymerase specialized sigma24 family protein
MTTAPKDPAGRTGAAEEFLLTHLSDVERVVAAVSFRHRLPLGERDELASLVRLKLVENDYEVIRRFEGRCSLHTYLAVVVQRVLLDWRRSRWGKWHSSAVARRLGPVALRLEALLYRDKRSLEDAIETLLQSGSGVSADELAALARRLPPRVARREVEEEAARDLPTDGAVEDRILEAPRGWRAGWSTPSRPRWWRSRPVTAWS